MIDVLQRSWHRELAELVQSAESRLLIAAPFISKEGSSLITRHLANETRRSGCVELMTDLWPSHVCDGSLELAAVTAICEAATRSTLWHVPRLHAKVYVADGKRAILTSGNLTAGAFDRNVEYGLQIADRALVNAIVNHFQDFQATGTRVAITELIKYGEAAKRVRDTFVKQQHALDARLRKAFDDALGTAEDELIRLRLAGGAVHTVFARTIRYLLGKYGPLPTTRLHEGVQHLHPDLCDDSIDRVIDGRRFGKKWKHAVRTAQQQLKRSGEVTYADAIWRLADGR